MTLGRQENGAPETVFFGQVVRDLESLLRHLLGEHIQFDRQLGVRRRVGRNQPGPSSADYFESRA